MLRFDPIQHEESPSIKINSYSCKYRLLLDLDSMQCITTKPMELLLTKNRWRSRSARSSYGMPYHSQASTYGPDEIPDYNSVYKTSCKTPIEWYFDSILC